MEGVKQFQPMIHPCATIKLLSAECRARAGHRHAETLVYIVNLIKEYHMNNFDNIDFVHSSVAN